MIIYIDLILYKRGNYYSGCCVCNRNKQTNLLAYKRVLGYVR